jgi:hypothetical protein
MEGWLPGHVERESALVQSRVFCLPLRRDQRRNFQLPAANREQDTTGTLRRNSTLKDARRTKSHIGDTKGLSLGRKMLRKTRSYCSELLRCAWYIVLSHMLARRASLVAVCLQPAPAASSEPCSPTNLPSGATYLGMRPHRSFAILHRAGCGSGCSTRIACWA